MSRKEVIQKFFGNVVDPLPCPFCGSEPGLFQIEKHHNCGEPVFFAKLRCRNQICGVEMSLCITEQHWDTRSKIVKEIGLANISDAWTLTLWNNVYSKWNRRV